MLQNTKQSYQYSSFINVIAYHYKLGQLMKGGIGSKEWYSRKTNAKLGSSRKEEEILRSMMSQCVVIC